MPVLKPLPVTLKSHVVAGKLPGLDKELFKYLLDQCEGKTLTITLDYYVNKRSNMQLMYYWPVVVEYVLEGLIDVGYRREALSPQIVHDYLKSQFLKHLKKRVVNPVTKKYITKAPSTGDLTTWEFIDYVDGICIWASTFLNIAIPAPNKEWREKALADYNEALLNGLIDADERSRVRIALKLDNFRVVY